MTKRQLLNARARRGFTLIELLVGLALSIFIMSLTVTMFAQASKTVSQMQGIMAIDQQVRSAVSTIRRDLTEIYVATDSVKLPLSQVFSSLTNRPTQGYFTIEENSPAIRQGVDQWGLPVDVDIDDVLSFTVQRQGTSPSEMFYAKVPVDGFLDNYPNYRQRFDEQHNGLFASPFAEVSYFLRPENGQYSFQTVRGFDTDTTPTAPSAALGPTPPTFTLFRRQAVVLPSSASDDIATQATLQNIPATDFYQTYAVAAKPVPTGMVPKYFTFPVGYVPAGNMYFPNITQMSQRFFRFGLNHAEDNEFPYSWSGSATNSSAVAAPRVFNARTIADPQWIGRPASLEVNATFGAGPPNVFGILQTVFSNNNADSNRNGVVDGNGTNAVLTATDAQYAAKGTIPHSYGEEVLLKHVLSFDVKVLDDDPRVEVAPTTPAAAAIRSSPRAAVNVLRAAADDERLGEFVDLGYLADPYPSTTIAAEAPDTLTDASTEDSHYDDPLGSYYGFREAKTTRSQPGAQNRWRHQGRDNVGIAGATYVPLRTYDTWCAPSLSAATPGYKIDPDPAADPSPNVLRPIPYPKPLKAIQITIRILEPKSGIVRDVQIVHAF